MPRVAKALTNFQVKSLNKPGKHNVGVVPGLRLQIAKAGSKSWILRTNVHGKTREIGLGGYPTISLKKARDNAVTLIEQIRSGIDPIEQRKQVALEKELAKAKIKTFAECKEAFIANKEPEWANPKSSQQWHSTLDRYAMFILGKLPVSVIETHHIQSVLEPIWSKIPDTATKLRGRIEMILNYATTSGYRSGENPARYKGHLDNILPSPTKLIGNNHHPALDYHDINRFMEHLKNVQTTSAKALELLILTAARSGEIRNTTWDEIDLNHNKWTIPAERMKTNKQHEVPLSKQAISLLKSLDGYTSQQGLLFPGAKGKVMSDMTLSKLVKSIHKQTLDADEPGFIDKHADNKVVTPHGFRSTFRDWAGEQSNFSSEVIEHALAHKIKDKAEAAYQRGTLMPKRIKLMQLWSQYAYESTNMPYENVINL